MLSSPSLLGEAAPGEGLTHHGVDSLDPMFPPTQPYTTCPDDDQAAESKDTAACSSFLLFGKLPPEIRIHIWHISLREADGPVLLPYRRACLRLVDVSEPDEACIAGQKVVRAEFDPHLLDKVFVPMHLAAICRESRCAALSWITQTEMRPCANRQGSGFARPFDQSRDTLYIEPDKARAFVCEWEELIWDTGGGPLIRSAIARLAVSESFLRDQGIFPPRPTGLEDTSVFEDMLEAAPCANLILVVVDEQPGWRDNALKLQRRWVTEDAGDYRLSWDPDRERFEVAACQSSGNIDEYAWMKAICETWIPWLVRRRLRPLEVRPVRSIRQRPSAAG
ncbi:hypothetical protein Purlil1_13152 [Purpureocillium lilacinum]|uniref:2EXR domain-containing protein n=1 Tax=Purpureocillium lilacinum TaxID=33203 RepID=A0ABR0BFJ7_PURLI|nr:hypothetical protein Purlil1_13152 [Purpureocillium lilacinum]